MLKLKIQRSVAALRMTCIHDTSPPSQEGKAADLNYRSALLAGLVKAGETPALPGFRLAGLFLTWLNAKGVVNVPELLLQAFVFLVQLELTPGIHATSGAPI